MEVVFEIIFITLFYCICYPIGKGVLNLFFRNIKISDIKDNESLERNWKRLKITYAKDDVKYFHSDTVVFTGFIFIIILVVVIAYIFIKNN